MKVLVAVFLLAVVAASSALAQSDRRPRQGRDSQRSDFYYGQSDRRAHSSNPRWDVYRTDGGYAGSDPDPQIRMNLFRDDPHTDE